VALFAGSAVLAAAFGVSQRYGRYPMLTIGLVRNRQFMGANTAFLLFGVGVMGQLFMLVMMVQNLWHYSQLKAAFAIAPVALLGLLVAPIAGRFSDRLQPRQLGVPALLGMSGGLLWLSAAPADPHYLQILGPMILTGASMGAAFPAINVGAMGSVSGQELGLGSGIVNMSRQLGFAIGVALLVAVFESHALGSPDQVSDAFSASFRVAALVTLLAVPFAFLMRRSPADAHAAAAASG
jgi:MFS family permease